MKNYLSLIKFSHTVFALPFAMVGFFLASAQFSEGINVRLLVLVVACMVFARSAAMAFNRYLDRDIDAQNPRTAIREIPAGKISARAALAFVVLNSLAFMLATWYINQLCFYLSPVALLVILGYSYTKRFTFLCHFVLGLGLSLAPIGAYLAVTGRFDVLPVVYSAIVLLWVSGFDVIYALQDEFFDKSQNLNSIPVKMGTAGALRLSVWVHILCALALVFAVFKVNTEGGGFGWLHTSGAVVFLVLLAYQHTLVTPNDLRRVDLKFMTTNGVASVVYGACFVLDFLF